MDTITLVKDRIDDGLKLIARLVQKSIPVKVAFWIQAVDEDQGSLYIATPLVEEKGVIEAYREVYRELRALGNLWVTGSDIKLIGARHPLAAEVLKLQQRYPGMTQFGHVSLGGLAIEQGYIYPLPPGGGTVPPEQRRLKKEVEQIAHPEDVLLTEQERAIRARLVSSGVSFEEAEKWIRRKRPQPPSRPKISAGTLVKAWVAAYWGDKPEDDPNPLLMVEAPDGTRGLVLKNDTELVPGKSDK